MYGHLRSRSDEPGHRNCHRLYGFHSRVAITANVGVPLLGKDSFQEVDIAGVTMPVTSTA